MQSISAAFFCLRQVEGYLEELLLLCQRSEEYAQFVLGAMAAAIAPAVLGAARENAFRSGPFNLLVRELVAYYINLVRLPLCGLLLQEVPPEGYRLVCIVSGVMKGSSGHTNPGFWCGTAILQGPVLTTRRCCISTTLAAEFLLLGDMSRATRIKLGPAAP